MDHLHNVWVRFGCTEAAGGRRHLILEILAYADEVAENIKRMGTSRVTYLHDGRVSVADNGRGTDTRRDSKGEAVRKPVTTTRMGQWLLVTEVPVRYS